MLHVKVSCNTEVVFSLRGRRGKEARTRRYLITNSRSFEAGALKSGGGDCGLSDRRRRGEEGRDPVSTIHTRRACNDMNSHDS